jgi:hypothetical protein
VSLFDAPPQLWVAQSPASQKWKDWTHHSLINTPLQFWDDAFTYDRRLFATTGKISVNVMTQTGSTVGLGFQDFVITP